MHLSNRSCTVNPRAQLGSGRRRRSERFHLEALEARCMLAADVVIEWDQVLSTRSRLTQSRPRSSRGMRPS
jgi:hypothetical protein